MSEKLKTIAFDADDTLWHNEQFFRITQERFYKSLADFTDPETLSDRLLEAERRNLGHYGFGVKGFVLSMIETAIDVTDGKVSASVISDLMEAGREMLEHPIDLLPHVRETLTTLSASYRLAVITKGDLLDQERKVAQSGLGEFFDVVEIVSDKNPETYARIFGQLDGVNHSMMIGNSLKSDVLPALSAGAWGVHVPHDLTWALEHAEAPQNAAKFHALNDLGDLPSFVHNIST